MADTVNYAEIVKDILRKYAAIKPSHGDIVVEAIFDDAQGHYEMVYSGWDGWRRVHGSVLHVDIRDDKIWIQHDGTEGGITDELLEAGIPAQHIVLAFHHPSKRQFTEFAVA